MPTPYSTDIVIFGGGMAGLWLLNRLQQQGIHCILLDKHGLGNGQSLASQGIIHGGLKYALSGSLTPAAQAIADMPARWRDCFAGTGEIDLSPCRILSEHYYMWSDGGMRSKLKTFLGSKSLRGRVDALERAQYPAAMAQANTNATLYQLPDFVIDTESVLQTLAANYSDRILAYSELSEVARDESGKVRSVTISHNDNVMELGAAEFILCAGEGNAGLLQAFAMDSIATQLRPLKMVYLKQPGLPELYLHCIGSDFSLTPELTVTSHHDEQGTPVWYLGGELAESGVGKEDAELVQDAKALLQRFLPWIDVSAGEFHCLAINRAEADVGNGYRPDDAFIAGEANMIAAWPTKLTLAPSLADKVIEHLQDKLPQDMEHADVIMDLPKARLGVQPWNRQ